MALVQSTNTLPDTPLSLASPLLQV